MLGTGTDNGETAAMTGSQQKGADVRFPPPLAYAGTFAAGMLLGRFVWDRDIPLIGHGFERTLGAFTLMVGLAILFTAVGLFRKARTNLEPWKPASTLVTEGVYRWTRNPIYLGMALAYAGGALMTHSLITLLLLAPLLLVIQRRVIEPEERYLETRFGDAYRAYRAETRRGF